MAPWELWRKPILYEVDPELVVHFDSFSVFSLGFLRSNSSIGWHSYHLKIPWASSFDGSACFVRRTLNCWHILFMKQECIPVGCVPPAHWPDGPPLMENPPGWRTPPDGELPPDGEPPPGWRTTPPDGEHPRMENPPDGEPPPMENPPRWRTPPDGEPPPPMENPPYVCGR